MKASIKEALQIARQRERKNPSDENITRVQKLIYTAMLQSKNKVFAQEYKEKHKL